MNKNTEIYGEHYGLFILVFINIHYLPLDEWSCVVQLGKTLVKIKMYPFCFAKASEQTVGLN